MPEPRRPARERVARQTQGEGVPERKRKEATQAADQRAEPQRGEEPADARLIERRRDARNPQGI